MPKKDELSIKKRARIQILHEQGKFQVQISKLVKCSRCAVQSAIKRFTETESHVKMTKTGRKRVTIKRQDRKLVRKSIRNRKKTSFELAAALSEEVGQPISARTATRRLAEASLTRCKARKKPWLVSQQQQKLLEMASSTSTFYGRELVKCSVVR